MAYDNTLTLVGNMTRDPELTFIASGSALCKFSIADNQKKLNGEEVAHYFDCVAWSDLAENIAESFSKGQRVIVHGRLKQDRWENKDGDSRQKVEITVEDAGHALKWATSVATKNAASGKQREAPRLDPKPEPEVEPF